MPIAIECQQCHSAFKVDDKLAGKKVKCSQCGQPIAVPGEVPATGRECLSCGAPMAEGARVCRICGFDEVTGRKDATFMPDVKQIATVRKKRWVRRSDSPLLEMLDRLFKTSVLLGTLAGVIFAVVHIVQSPAGFSIQALLPMGVVLVMLAAIMAPLATLAVNRTILALKLPPRDDNYTRILAVLLLPFAAGLLAGWPEQAAQWGWVPRLAWLCSAALLVYFFRGEILEWGAAVLAAVIALVLALLLANVGNMMLTSATGPLYADMLPTGVWQGLTSGHSPEPAPVPEKTAPAPTLAAAGQPAANGAAANPRGGEPGANHPGAMAGTNDQTPGSGGMQNGARTRVVTESPFFAGVIDERDLRDAAAIVLPPGAADWMLSVKNSGTSTEVDRWSVNPLEKKERLSYLYYAKMPAQFAISSRGDVAAALVFFPRRQLEIVTFDGKTAKNVIPLDVPANMPDGSTQAVPTLLGIADAAHFYVRWDLNGNGVLQKWSATPPRGLMPGYVPLGPVAAQGAAMVVSPNGRLAAAFGRNQIAFNALDAGVKPAPLVVASDNNVRLFGQSFSPDSGQIAVYAGIADLPTVRVFQLRGGDAVNGLLSESAVDRDFTPAPHALLWLPTCDALLLNGNDLVDPQSGKKFASLGLEGVVDEQAVAGNLVAFTFSGDAGPRTILVKLDDAAIRAAKK